MILPLIKTKTCAVLAWASNRTTISTTIVEMKLVVILKDTDLLALGDFIGEFNTQDIIDDIIMEKLRVSLYAACATVIIFLDLDIDRLNVIKATVP